MQVQTIQIPPKRVIMMRHTGSYDDIGPLFDRLWQWAESRGVNCLRSIGIYWDNAEITPVNQLRSAACIEVSLDFILPDTGGQPIEAWTIPGGEYATTRYVGPYEQMGPVWSQFTNTVEQSMGRSISDNPAFEVYVNDPSDTPPSQLVTDLFTPVS